MIEDAQRIFEYLPVSFRNETEQEYIDFLWKTFMTNYEDEKYHFAFLAYHMLFMCFVYFEIWQIRQSQKEDFEKALVGFNREKESKLIEATSPFALKDIEESVVFRFLKLIGLNNSDIGKCTKLVKDRNEAAHSNGNIFFRDQHSLDLKIEEILRCVEIIQNQSRTTVERCYTKFLLESADPEIREHLEDEDQIREILVYGNYLSWSDVVLLQAYDTSQLKQQVKYPNILNLIKKLPLMYPPAG